MGRGAPLEGSLGEYSMEYLVEKHPWNEKREAKEQEFRRLVGDKAPGVPLRTQGCS